MLIRNVYSIRDIKAKTYLGLITLRTDEEACRWFLTVLERSDLGKHPKDYHLHQLATLNDDTGEMHKVFPPHDATPHSAVDSFVIEREEKRNGSQSKKDD